MHILKTKRQGNFPCLSFLLIAVLGLFFQFVAKGQATLKNSIGMTPALVFDADYPGTLGKSFDIFYERKIWKNLYMKGGFHYANTQRLLGDDKQPLYRITATWYDHYAEYFRGQPRENFLPSASRSFVKNVFLFNASISYRFGKKNQFVPEIGYNVGSAYEASIFLKGASFSGDTIVNATTETLFIRNNTRGLNLGISYAIHIKNNFFIQPSLRFMIINNPIHIVRPRIGANGSSIYEGFNFGVTIRKDLK